MQSVLNLISELANIYIIVILASVVMSWLIAFEIINRRNRFVYTLWDTFNRVTEPVLGPIRRLLPNLGGLDISPIIVILGLMFLRDFLGRQFGAWGF